MKKWNRVQVYQVVKEQGGFTLYHDTEKDTFVIKDGNNQVRGKAEHRGRGVNLLQDLNRHSTFESASINQN